jgi:hypothetical protein
MAEVTETPPPEVPVEIKVIMDEVEDGSLKEAADKVAGQFALTSAGDTCLMRHRRVLPGISRDIRRQIAAARIAENSGGPEIQANLLTSLTGLPRWRVLLQMADVALRTGKTALAEQYISEAIAISDIPLICTSDTHLFTARLANIHGQSMVAAKLLDAATKADPANFNAHFERAVHAVMRVEQGNGGCTTAVIDMVDSTVRMEALISTSTQLFRLSERISQLQVTDRSKSFLLGFIEERAGTPAAAKTLYENGLTQMDQATSAPCHDALRSALDLSMKRVITRGTADP